MREDLEGRNVCLRMARTQVDRSLELTWSIYGTNVKALISFEDKRTNRIAKWVLKRSVSKSSKNAVFQAGLATRAVENIIAEFGRDDVSGFVADNIDDWMRKVNETEDEMKAMVEMTRVCYEITRKAKEALKRIAGDRPIGGG